MNDTDYTMAGATFVSVGDAKNEFCLKDVAVKLSAANEPQYNRRWRGGCYAPGGFQLNLLNKNGAPEVTYYWQYYKEGDEFAPTITEGWFKDDGAGNYIPLTAAELSATIKAGQGFYIMGNGNSLAPAGQVSNMDIEFECNETDYTVCGNGTPVDLTLGDLTVRLSAANEPQYNRRWRGGCYAPGGFQVNFLNKNGAPEATYYWQYYKEGDENVPTITEGWFKDDGTGNYVKIEKAELDTIKVPAGKMLYIMGNGNTLVVTAPEL